MTAWPAPNLAEPSEAVCRWVAEAEERRGWLINLQVAHGVDIPCDMDLQFSGVAEGWAAGLTWRELIDESGGLDEGDIARLLRRTIDLLNQIPHLPQTDVAVRKAARQAANVSGQTPHQ